MKRIPLVLALIFSLSVPLVAQVPTGAITGTVIDPSGAVINGATVTVTNKSNGATRVVQTDADCAFFVPSLAAGA